MNLNNQLIEKIKTIPTFPGVYLMKGSENKIIYVGKAKNLKNRVMSYFNNGEKTHKTEVLVDQILDFDVIITHTEVEALLLERTLIKHHKPKYNILLKDDKNYPFIRVNFKDPWPKIQKVRKRKNDGAEYFGPFPNVSQLNLLLKRIYRIFPLIRCSDHVFKTAKRPCNYYHIKLCLAPCVLKIEKEFYISMVKNSLKLLQGKSQPLIKELKNQMNQASEEEAYERAANYRDQIVALQSMSDNQTVILKEIEEADIVNYYIAGESIFYNIMWVRDYAINGSFSIESKIPIEIEKDDIIESFLIQYYESNYVPKKIVIPHELTSKETLQSLFEKEKNQKTNIIWKSSSSKKTIESLLEKCHINARHSFEESSKVIQKNFLALSALKDTLKLKNHPDRIECLDISNFGSDQIVAGLVSIKEGEFDKKNYKKYIVKSLEKDKQSDFHSIEEVVERRIKRGIEEDDLPDLLVIDGGKGQLSSAIKAKNKFPDLDLEIVSLAKSRTQRSRSSIIDRSYERVFKENLNLSIPLIDGTPPYLMMVKIRDETHRFAISFHRKKRNQKEKKSFLDDIAGVGPATKKSLIQHFGSIQKIKSATLIQLQEVKGVSKKVAENIYGSIIRNPNNRQPK